MMFTVPILLVLAFFLFEAFPLIVIFSGVFGGTPCPVIWSDPFGRLCEAFALSTALPVALGSVGPGLPVMFEVRVVVVVETLVKSAVKRTIPLELDNETGGIAKGVPVGGNSKSISSPPV